MTSLAKVRALPDLRLPRTVRWRPPPTPARTSCWRTTSTGWPSAWRSSATAKLTAYDVAGELGWTRHERRLGDPGLLQRRRWPRWRPGPTWILLEARGEITSSLVDGVDVYRRTSAA